MRREINLLLPVLFAALLLGSGSDLSGAAPATASVPPEDSLAPDSLAPDLFTGFLVPANATEIYAPETNFRVRGWNSNWGQVSLIELAPDGKEVKEGDVVARLEFIGRDALDWINRRIQETEANGSQAKVTASQTLDALLMESRRRALELQQAGLDVQREKAISKRQAELFRIRQKIAEFEVQAVTERIATKRKATDAENTYQNMLIKSVRSDLDRYKFYQKRFEVLAPHPGIVRHAFNSKAGRKIQKGDGISAGQRILSLAKDGVLAAKFFVPEHRLTEVTIGGEVLVTTTASAEEHNATVTKIDFFPQELSFLAENPNLPNGQEKAFAVTAEFKSGTGDISAGAEIRAKAKPR
ncbi:MAG: HlyD family efflux transporter periplasmic adaptor subunit [Myxococcota bacterium]|jgi:biotin carboxyl carrier protein|nr:HlyD family efflux transporter periplasmic adaptor subunit [Myxococcota bacterium]